MEKCRNCVSAITVEPVLYLYTICYMSQFGLYQDLTYFKVCRSSYNDTICSNLKENKDIENIVQEESSYWVMASMIALQAPAFVFTIYLGSWSDRFGRKFPLMLSPAGGLLSTLTLMFASAYEESPIWLIVLANFILGLFGGLVACIVNCVSYITAVTKEKNWTVRIARTESMDFLGGTTGPFFTGLLVSYVGSPLTFFFLSCVHVINVIYLIFILREVPPPPLEENSKFDKSVNCCTRYFTLEHIKDYIVSAFKKREGSNRKFILLLTGAMLMVGVIHIGSETIFYLYVVGDPLRWDYPIYSYYIAFKEAMGTISLMFLVPAVKKYISNDWILLVMAVVSRMMQILMMGLSFNSYIMFAAPIVGCFSFFSFPASRTVLASLVHPTEQGKLIAFISNTECFTHIIGSLIYNTGYPATRLIYTGFMYLISVAAMLIPLIMFGWMFINTDQLVLVNDEKKTDEKDNKDEEAELAV